MCGAFNIAVSTPEKDEVLFEDERRFIDHSSSSVWLAEEHVFVDG